MPFNAIPQSEFRNRESELGLLVRLAGEKDAPDRRGIILLGPRGSGKTELVKQVCHRLFWEEGAAVPFYYRFRRATLKARHFSRDYFSRFIRQFTACLAGDPSLIDNMSVPIDRLISKAPYPVYSCLSGLVEDFNAQAGADDLPGQVLAAVTAPLALAECTGRRLVIMLDDFHLVREVYESAPGDTPGVVGMFEEAMRSPSAMHVVTGSPEAALEAMFADDSLLGSAVRLRLEPLPEDEAAGLFEDCCRRHGDPAVTSEARSLVRHLLGNPLYIRNVARAVAATGCREVSAQAFMESYSLDVSEGETAAYWSSVMARGLDAPRQKGLALGIMVRAVESPETAGYTERLSRMLGAPEKTVEAVVEALGFAGMLPGPGSAAADTVMYDHVRAAGMLAAGEGPNAVRDAVIKRRFGGEAAAPMSFDMAIPKLSEAELVAAKALEQICSLTELGPEDAQRLSMAIIEACINAMEHGGYGDRVFLRCAVYPGSIEVSVESRGGRIDASALRRSESMPGLDSDRGRGFPLMKRLVDDVRVETAGGRTRVVLVKKIKRVREQNEELHA